MGIILNHILWIKKQKSKVSWLAHFHKAGKWWKRDLISFQNKVATSLNMISRLKGAYCDSFCVVKFRVELQQSPWTYSFYLFIFVYLDLPILGVKRTFYRNVLLCLIFFKKQNGQHISFWEDCHYLQSMLLFQLYPDLPRPGWRKSTGTRYHIGSCCSDDCHG